MRIIGWGAWIDCVFDSHLSSAALGSPALGPEQLYFKQAAHTEVLMYTQVKTRAILLPLISRKKIRGPF